MAVPALLERVSHEDSDQSRWLSGHDVEAAIGAIRANSAALAGTGTWLTVAEFKAQINSTADDDTDIDNIVDLVTSQSNDGKKNAAVFGIQGILNLCNMGYFSAAAARTRLGIPTP